MSTKEGWGQSIWALRDFLKQKETITTISLFSIMAAAYWGLRRLHLQQGPALQNIHSIRDNIMRAWENNHGCLCTLPVEEQVLVESRGVCMHFTLIATLKKKDQSKKELTRNPFLPPFEEGLFIQDLGSTHRLLFNKFNVFERHLLVTTKEFEPQSAPLSRDDFKQTINAFRANKGLYYFNSGPEAGSSQPHKHIQIFPQQARELPLFAAILEFVRGREEVLEELTVIQFPPFNFLHGLVVLGEMGSDSGSDSAQKGQKIDKGQKIGKGGKAGLDSVCELKEKTIRAYQLLCSSLIDGDYPQQYNLVGCQQFVMLVPRRKEAAFDQLPVNAVGFMGSVLFKSKQTLAEYATGERGLQILQDITFPRKQSQ